MRKELLNFYTWQHRNTQKERKLLPLLLDIYLKQDTSLRMFIFIFADIAELRKKFEEDKQRIALMRAQRKFKPYWINFF